MMQGAPFFAAVRCGRFPHFLGLGVVAAVWLAVGPMPHVLAGQPQRPPNILLLIADDLGWHDIGYHGSDIHTPQLDRLARDGVRLERYYVYPTCSPTRAGVFTGCNPSRFGILGPIDLRSELALPKTTANLASVLKSCGYATALVGKWHLGLRPETGPRQYGFDQTYGFLHGQVDQYTHRYKNGDQSWHRNDVFVDEQGHATDLIAHEAVRLIEAKPESPFFYWVAFSAPHTPLEEDANWIAPYQESISDPSRRLYAACVSHMDAAIGQIVAALEKTGQLDNTLIFFMSDNGGEKGSATVAKTNNYEGKHGPFPTLGDNRPLRGWKAELYEGGVRVPAFLCWRGHLQPAAIQEPISYLDWLPTFARLAGAEVAPQAKLEGRDVWPLLSGEKKTLGPATLYWNTGPQSGVLQGDWKLILPGRKGTTIELFHLSDDLVEQKNLAAENPAKVAELRALLDERLSQQSK